MTPACPRCTFRKALHPVLSGDIVSVPVFAAGKHGLAHDEAFAADIQAGKRQPKARWHCVDGCAHAQDGLDDYEFLTREEIEAAWQGIVDKLNQR